MGNVAIGAAPHVGQEMNGTLIEELAGEQWFPVIKVDVKDGVIATAHRPRNLLFRCHADDDEDRELIVFIGEAQPERDGYDLCRSVIHRARELGVRHVATCAAMAGPIHPQDAPRVHVAATDLTIRDDAISFGARALADGQVSGLNGLILAAAAETGMDGVCLLGDMPYFTTGMPNPRASEACLKVFSQIAGFDLSRERLQEQADALEPTMTELLEKLEDEISAKLPGMAQELAPRRERRGSQQARDQEQEQTKELYDEAGPTPLDPETLEQIEELFAAAEKNRAKAGELKRLLDEHGVITEYEDRCLDLFKRGE
jgi:proteasome assembly chaperone (PAC2) family protein